MPWSDVLGSAGVAVGAVRRQTVQQRSQRGFHWLGLLLAGVILLPALIALWQWLHGKPGPQGLTGIATLCIAAAAFYVAVRVLGLVLTRDDGRGRPPAKK
jgi:hypothetical protein